MTLLPIVDRELAVASRRAATYWLRFGVAAGAVAIFFVSLLSDSDSITEMGQDLFIYLGSAMLGFSMLSGVFLTADSLSAEKREGTLGLLFLTDLKGYDVVLGKLAASSLQAFFGLLAVFPVLALPLLTGGRSGGEFWRTILVLTVTMYLSLAIGMLVSAASREGRQAIPRTFGAITLLAGVLPLLWELQSLGGGHLDFLLWPSPVYAYIKGFDDSYLTRYGAQEFWTALATLFSLASGCIITASIHLPRSWQKDSAADPNMERPHFHFFSETPRRRRPPLADKNPFFWLALGDRFGTWILALLGLLWAVMMALSAVLPQDMGVQLGMMVAFGLHLAAKVLIASESGRRFHQDRQSGALEVLLATPLPARDIVAGQREALWKQIQPALWLISMVNVLTLWVFLFMSTSDSGGFGLEEFISVLEVFLGGVVMLWLDASALIWLGMWRGLKAKKYPRSVLANLAQVLLPPWLAIFFLAFVLVGSASEVDVIILLAFWFGLGAVIDISAIEFAQNNLVKSLRSIVSEGPAGHSF